LAAPGAGPWGPELLDPNWGGIPGGLGGQGAFPWKGLLGYWKGVIFREPLDPPHSPAQAAFKPIPVSPGGLFWGIVWSRAEIWALAKKRRQITSFGQLVPAEKAREPGGTKRPHGQFPWNAELIPGQLALKEPAPSV